jgi:hypothetical protein
MDRLSPALWLTRLSPSPAADVKMPASVMIEKFAALRGMVLSEFLDLITLADL